MFISRFQLVSPFSSPKLFKSINLLASGEMLPFQIEVERDEERVENDGHRSIQKIQTKPAIPTFTNPEAMRIEENSNSALVA